MPRKKGRRKIPRYQLLEKGRPGNRATGRALPVNPGRLSAASQRSLFFPDEYHDVKQQCVACGKTFFLSAEDQKEAYEEHKVYIYADLNRCVGCQHRYSFLKRKLKAWHNRSTKALSQQELRLLLGQATEFRNLQEYGNNVLVEKFTRALAQFPSDR